MYKIGQKVLYTGELSEHIKEQGINVYPRHVGTVFKIQSILAEELNEIQYEIVNNAGESETVFESEIESITNPRNHLPEWL